MGDPAIHERRIRSFVLRQGRITPAQQRAFDAHWPRYGLDYTRHAARLRRELRPRGAARARDRLRQWRAAAALGAGRSRTRDFIGIEVHRPGVGRLMNALAEAGVDNVRVYNHDAVEVLRAAKSRRHARRSAHLLPRSLAQEAPPQAAPDPAGFRRTCWRRACVAGGRLHLATDWADYAEHMQSVLDAAPRWRTDPRPCGARRASAPGASKRTSSAAACASATASGTSSMNASERA